MTPLTKRLVFVSVVPSPYQRDVFRAIADRRRVPIEVYYLEAAAPDSPWPAVKLEPWEHVLPGFTFGQGSWRSHVNPLPPTPQPGDTWIVNGAMTDLTTQWLMRRLGRRHRWCFWGELPSTPRTLLRRWLQARQYAPLRRSRAIVAVGTRAQDAYQRLVPGVRVHNQPYACRLEGFAAAAARRKANPEPVFLFCGQMIARKGIDVLLSAFARLVAEGVHARLLLVGREAGLSRLLTGIDSSTLRRIDYAGFQPPEDLPKWFARADVFVLPSRHDGWGVVVNQACGAGLPLICSTAVGAAHDQVEDGINGFKVPPDDSEALAAAMRRLALSPELRETCRAGATAVAERLSPERAAAFWEELGESLEDAS